ncbi:hypothetical protein [Chryseobacterium lathyri]|uniref:hypothetical protein n=1 Tax=Chryseobacterium lathyri TaxID=395933 RepID=UPI00277D663F|nr:hypothetical protein [Chryseobacterium lathyri]MDQ0067467.1 hypothetical protein [Chryseobacterium lathyri]
MSTNRNILEKMSDQELEQYINPESRFTPEAVKYASEILQSRGRIFSAEEEERISASISSIQNHKEAIIHPNHTKAANLMYLSGALGIGNMIWIYESLNSPSSITGAIATLAFIFGMGYLASKGTDWIKYVLLIIFLIGLIGIQSIYLNLLSDPVLGILSIAQTILQIWTIIVLFQVPKS